MVELSIAAGEVVSGCTRIFIGLAFAKSAVLGESKARIGFRILVATLLMVDGFEEIADALVEEGSGVGAYVIQGVCTSLQAITGVIGAFAAWKAKLFTKDYAR